MAYDFFENYCADIDHFFSRTGDISSENDPEKKPEKSFDPALFDVTKIPVDDFANQITIDDFEIFKKITPEEVSDTWQMIDVIISTIMVLTTITSLFYYSVFSTLR